MGAKYISTYAPAPTLNLATYNCQLNGYIDCDSNGYGHTCVQGMVNTGTMCIIPKANPPQSSYDPKTGCPTGSTYNGQICVYQQTALYGEVPSSTATTPCQFLSFVTFDIVPCKPHAPSTLTICDYGTDSAGKCLAAPTQTVSSTPTSTSTIVKPDCTGKGYDPTTNTCFNLGSASTATANGTPDCTGQGYDAATNTCFDPASVQGQIDLLNQKLAQVQSGGGNNNSTIQSYQQQIDTLKSEIASSNSGKFIIPTSTYYWIAGIVIVIAIIVVVATRKKN